VWEDAMPDKKIVILAAVSGGSQQDREGAKVPCTPAEIADEALRCYEAGASVIHIHARDENKQPTGDLKMFSEIIARIRDKCDILIQTTNGIGSKRDPVTGQISRPTDDERLALINIEPRQDLYSIAGGSWDFYHPGVPGKNEFSFANSSAFLRKFVPNVLKTGGALEFEITEASYLPKLRRLADEGVFDGDSDRFWLDYCIGFGGLPATPRALVYAVEEGQRLFPKTKWQICATHTDQFPMSTVAMFMGCDIVRVGFEDNIYLPNGKAARNNGDLVDAMTGIVRQFGNDVASVAEARQVFGIGN
jgi:3-keto-5-aminohexanoate cleavage enzyme